MLGECDEVDVGTLHSSFRRPSPAFSLQNLRYAPAAADYGSFVAPGGLAPSAIDAQPLCPSARSVDRHGCLRKVERRRSSNPSGPSVPPQRALNFGAGGSAGGEDAEHGPRRGRQAYGRVLHVPRRRESSRYADRRFPTISAARARNVRELARSPRHSDAKRSGRHCDYSGGHGAASIENNVVVERAHSRRDA